MKGTGAQENTILRGEVKGADSANGKIKRTRSKLNCEW